MIEVTPGEDVRLVISVQSKEWRWNVGITQVGRTTSRWTTVNDRRYFLADLLR